jgi:hypothetical protein
VGLCRWQHHEGAAAVKRTVRRRTFAQIRAEEAHKFAGMLEQLAASIRPQRAAPPVEQIEMTEAE